MSSFYATRIAELSMYDPRLVEAWMRLEHGTLDALTPERFEHEVCAANDCVHMHGAKISEELARSYGL